MRTGRGRCSSPFIYHFTDEHFTTSSHALHTPHSCSHRLTQEGKVMRTGRGGRSSPFIYHLTDEARQAALVATKAAGIAVQVQGKEEQRGGRLT